MKTIYAILILITSTFIVKAQNVSSPISITPFVAETFATKIQSGESLTNKYSDHVGIAFDIPKGWKTYWRTPGASGVPTEFKWAVQKNIKSLKIYWPFPEVENDGYGISYIYKDQFILPIVVEREDQSRPAYLKGDLLYGACAEICIPADYSIDISLDAGKVENLIGNMSWKKAYDAASHAYPPCHLEHQFQLTSNDTNTFVISGLSSSTKILVEGLSEPMEVHGSFELDEPVKKTDQSETASYEFKTLKYGTESAPFIRFNFSSENKAWEVVVRTQDLDDLKNSQTSMCI